MARRRISGCRDSGVRRHSPPMGVAKDQRRHSSASANGITYLASSVRTSENPASVSIRSTRASVS